jgi:hypothetical protein
LRDRNSLGSAGGTFKTERQIFPKDKYFDSQEFSFAPTSLYRLSQEKPDSVGFLRQFVKRLEAKTNDSNPEDVYGLQDG